MDVIGYQIDCVHLLYYKCHQTNFKPVISYINSPDWIKNRKATINPFNKKYNLCFQYAVTVAWRNKKGLAKNNKIDK